MAHLILDEPLTGSLLIGALFVTTGVYLTKPYVARRFREIDSDGIVENVDETIMMVQGGGNLQLMY